MATSRPAFRLFDAAMIATTTFVLTVILRVATGSYPPLWGLLTLGAVVGAAWAIGASAGQRQRERAGG